MQSNNSFIIKSIQPSTKIYSFIMKNNSLNITNTSLNVKMN